MQRNKKGERLFANFKLRNYNYVCVRLLVPLHHRSLTLLTTHPLLSMVTSRVTCTDDMELSCYSQLMAIKVLRDYGSWGGLPCGMSRLIFAMLTFSLVLGKLLLKHA